MNYTNEKFPAVKNMIPEEDVVGKLEPILDSGPFCIPEGGAYRDVEKDIQDYNQMIAGSSIQEILHNSSPFLGHRYGFLKPSEIYLQSHPTRGVALLVQSKCRCGNIVIAPLQMLVSGALFNCGCRSPLPESEEISVFQSEEPTPWSTTVDGIQWLGHRYTWFVSFVVDGQSVIRKYTTDTHEALECLRMAERKYYGRSVVDQYGDLMFLELEQLKQDYISRHPPRIQGVIWNKEFRLWNARLVFNNEMVLNKVFKQRIDAVNARLQAEKRYYGAPFLPEEYYR